MEREEERERGIGGLGDDENTHRQKILNNIKEQNISVILLCCIYYIYIFQKTMSEGRKKEKEKIVTYLGY